MTITEVINALETMKSIEDDKLILETLNHELGYLDCLLEHNIEDTKRLKYIEDNILSGGLSYDYKTN